MDVVVTVPKSFGLDTWIDEGQLPGEAWNGCEYDFYLGGSPPFIHSGERVYIVYNAKVRGYAPLVRIDHQGPRKYSLVRHGEAVACTIPRAIPGFRGYRYRKALWQRAEEIPFPDWQVP